MANDHKRPTVNVTGCEFDSQSWKWNLKYFHILALVTNSAAQFWIRWKVSNGSVLMRTECLNIFQKNLLGTCGGRPERWHSTVIWHNYSLFSIEITIVLYFNILAYHSKNIFVLPSEDMGLLKRDVWLGLSTKCALTSMLFLYDYFYFIRLFTALSSATQHAKPARIRRKVENGVS